MSEFKCETCDGKVIAIAVEAYCPNPRCAVRKRVKGEGVRSFMPAMARVA